MQAPHPPNADALAIAEGLQRLATDSSKRSKAARLREVLPNVEAASAAGVNQSEIVKVLAASGLEISKKSLGVMLSRIRKKNILLAQTDTSSVTSSSGSSNLPASKPKTEKPLTKDKNTPPGSNIAESIDSQSTHMTSARRFRNQFVDLDAYAKLAPKGQT
jgi:predicted transcriptional regulator